jgi:tRNA dimethylallyltransferase
MMRGFDIPVLVIFGPTASGKTDLAARLFSSSGLVSPFMGRAEIISADSMQVYRGLNIGTAKPDVSFQKKLPHHLIDIVDPSEQFSAGDFVRLGDAACVEIWNRHKLPVILGGTAFYIRNFIYGLPVTPESDPEIRRILTERMKSEGASVLLKELEAVDPERARRIHIHDEYRIIRALEVFAASNRPLSSFALPDVPRAGYRFLVISLDRSRNELRDRINARVDAMFDAGLPFEFAQLMRKGYIAADPGMQAIGYREFFVTDPPGSDLARIKALIQTDSRKYAKRQETFIHTMSGVRHFSPDDITGITAAIQDFYGDFGT